MKKGPIVKRLRLDEILADPTKHQPERLIEIIQDPQASRVERDGAIIELIRRFQWFLRKTVTRLWKMYGSNTSYKIEDLFQDAMMEFCELAINDFKVKKSHDQEKLAVFGNYIETKLYRRLQWKMQKQVKAGVEQSVDFEILSGSLIHTPKNGRSTNRITAIESEALKYIVANALRHDQLVLDHMDNEEHTELLMQMVETGREVLTPRYFDIWHRYYITEETSEEISKHFSLKNKKNVREIAKGATDKIMAEIGRKHMIQRANLTP